MELKITKEEFSKKKLMVCVPMYGGMCHGAFTQSMLKLQGLCQQYGIGFSINFLFNESLIQRARTYLTDSFMRSDSTHLLFIDSDIQFEANDVLFLLGLQTEDSPYDIIGGAYPKKCLHHSAKVLTEDGWQFIGKIVRNQYNGNVWSYDGNGKGEWKKVIGWSDEPNYNKKWVSLVVSKERPRRWANCTDDHEIAIVKDLFSPKIEYVQAKNASGMNLVVYPNDNSNRRETALFSPQQLSVMIGTALGDGCCSEGTLGFSQGHKQLEYATYRHEVLNLHGNFLSGSITNAQTKKLGELIYEDHVTINSSRKTLKRVIDFIDPIALAFLYMDDGSMNGLDPYKSIENEYSDVPNEKNWWINEDTGEVKRSSKQPSPQFYRGRKPKSEKRKPKCSIATMSFSVEDNKLLMKHLKDKFDIDSYLLFLTPTKSGEMYPEINFDQENTAKFQELIAPYVHPSMRYKLRKEYRDVPFIAINSKMLDFGIKKITEIRYFEDPNNSHLYDITVEDNHNFVADYSLVHNCISWEKIKQAVDAGAADKNPAELEQFVGDFVFNPVLPEHLPEGQSYQLRLDEPVEIMELGTGFMMVRREALKKWEEAHPERLYLPDHVRTKDFDGSREIYEYFTVRVDPKSRRLLSEDYQLCHEFRDLGMKIWLCPWMKLTHMGTYAFGGSLMALASIGAAATCQPDLLAAKK